MPEFHETRYGQRWFERMVASQEKMAKAVDRLGDALPVIDGAFRYREMVQERADELSTKIEGFLNHSAMVEYTDSGAATDLLYEVLDYLHHDVCEVERVEVERVVDENGDEQRNGGDPS